VAVARAAAATLVVVAVTAAAARALPPSMLREWSLTAAINPITNLRDALETMVASEGAKGSLGAALSWALDAVEFGGELVKWAVWAVLLPITVPLKLFLWLAGLALGVLRAINPLPLLGSALGAALEAAPRSLPELGEALTGLVFGLAGLVLSFFDAIGTYFALTRVLVGTTLGSLWELIGTGLGILFNTAIFVKIDTMDPRRKIPAGPAFTVAKNIKVGAHAPARGPPRSHSSAFPLTTTAPLPPPQNTMRSSSRASA
jgi:hypothetical protein